LTLEDNDFLFKLPAGVDVLQNEATTNNNSFASNNIKGQELIDFVYAWARAWSAKDVDLYLSKYAEDFKTPNGDVLALWKASRKQKISSQGKILVEIEDIKVIMKNENLAHIQFRQKYTSEKLIEESSKFLLVKKFNSIWLIQEEASVKKRS
jgi:murein L,D-transpeptidase YafK